MEEITFDELCQNFDKVNENTDFMKSAHSKNITISDWNGLVAQTGKTLANVKNLYRYVKTVHDTLADHERRITSNTGRLDQYDLDIASHSSRLGEAECNIDGHTALLTEHSGTIDTQGSAISDLDGRVHGLENIDSGDRLNTVETTLKSQNIEVDTHTRAIDSLESQVDVLNSAVGVPGNVGVALGDFAVSLQNSIAGCKGYRYKAIDFANNRIYLTTSEIDYVLRKDLTSTEQSTVDKYNLPTKLNYEEILKLDNAKKSLYEGDILVTFDGLSDEESYELLEPDFDDGTGATVYEIGDVFTLKTRDYDYDKCYVIDTCFKNVIDFSSEFSFANIRDTKDASIVKKVDVLPDRYSFSVPSKPTIGEVVITKNSFACGSGAKAASKYGIAIGAGVLTYGDGGIAMGEYSEAGYQAIALGQYVEAKHRNVGIGYDITNEGTFALASGASLDISSNGAYSNVFGYQNKAHHRCVFMAGEKLGESKSDYQAIFGINPNVYESMAFIVGNGTEGAKSNAFHVWKDGRATVGAAPQGDFDVATKKYVDTVNTEHPIQKGAGDYSVQMRNSTASGIGAVALTGSKVNGTYGFGIGYGTKASATYAGAIGTSAVASSQNSIAIGQGVQTAAPEGTNQNRSQIVLGRFNAVLPGATDSNLTNGAVLIVGTGSGNNKRKNGLVVWADGHLEAGRSVSVADTDKTLVTLDYVRSLEQRVEWLERQLEN